MSTVGEIALLIRGEVIGDAALEIHGVAKIEEAHPDEITFLANEKYEKFFVTTNAGAIIVGKKFAVTEKKITYIAVDDPYRGFLFVLEHFQTDAKKGNGEIHPTAIIPSSASVGKNVTIGAYVVLSERNAIGDNVTICAGVFLGDDVFIGEKTFIYPNVTIRENCHRKNCIIHSVQYWRDGFGFSPGKDGVYKKFHKLEK